MAAAANPKSYSSRPGEVIADLPVFEHPPWLATLENSYGRIADNLRTFLASEHRREAQFEARYPNLMVGFWGRLDLQFWRMRHPNARFFEPTLAELAKIPMCTRATFNVLKAGASIRPHNGENDAYVRAHLGIVVPATLPHAGLRVADETRSWADGKVLAFCDAQNHEAFNHCDRDRIVLVIDVWREQYAHCLDQCVIHNFTTFHQIMDRKLTGRTEALRPGAERRYYNFYELELALEGEARAEYDRLYAYYAAHYRGADGFTDEAAERYWALWLESTKLEAPPSL